jgi:hypothetical protein
MANSIFTIPSFDRDFKQLFKKYLSLIDDLKSLKVILEENHAAGIALGNDCYKIRMAVKSKGRGKSGGTRVIYYTRVEKNHVVLLSMYDKSDQDTISDKELEKLLKQLL